MTVDPIHQFQIHNLVPIATIHGHEIAITNSALFMLLIVLLVSALLIGATAPRAVVPGRLQSVAEMSYEFVANTVRSSAGTEGMKFFPIVFTLFMFVLFANMIGLIPYSFTVTSQLIVTATLALLVFFIVVIYGFWRNGKVAVTISWLVTVKEYGMSPIILANRTNMNSVNTKGKNS